MTVKKRILISIGWFVLVMAIGVGGVFWIQSNTHNNEKRTQRAALLGTGLGCLGGVGFAALWLPFAYRLGKQKREEREELQRAAKRKASSGRKSRRGASGGGKSPKGESRSRSRRRKK